MVRHGVKESVQQSFVDPTPLYESGADLGVRVGVFEQHLRLDPGSLSRLREVSDALSARSPILDVGCGLGEPLLPVGPTIFDDTSVVGGDLSSHSASSPVTAPLSPSPAPYSSAPAPAMPSPAPAKTRGIGAMSTSSSPAAQPSAPFGPFPPPCPDEYAQHGRNQEQHAQHNEARQDDEDHLDF